MIVVEVETRRERRRHRSDGERATILSEAMEPGAVVAQMAHYWGVSTSQLCNRRKAMLVQAAPNFAQVQLAVPKPTPGPPTDPTRAGLIEIVLPGGTLVRDDAAMDGTFGFKPGLCGRRVRFVMFAPSRRQHRRCQAGNPLLGLSKSPEPPLCAHERRHFGGGAGSRLVRPMMRCQFTM